MVRRRGKGGADKKNNRRLLVTCQQGKGDFVKENYTSHAQMIFTLGNGDFRSGAALLEKLAMRLDHARDKHHWGVGKEIDTPTKAHDALYGEAQEWLRAMNFENHERQLDEALDCLAVAVRIYNKEFED